MSATEYDEASMGCELCGEGPCYLTQLLARLIGADQPSPQTISPDGIDTEETVHAEGT